VKELNPGFDLLLSADWSELLSWAKSPAFATGESPESPTAEPELVPIPSGSQPAQAPAADAAAPAAPAETPAPVATTPAPAGSAPISPMPGKWPSTLFIVAGLVLILGVWGILVGWRRS
jgi:hypothetical protein